MDDVRVDFEVENHGSIVLLRPVTDEAKKFADDYIGDRETLHFGNALVVEPRYIDPILAGIEADGLTVGLF